MIFVLCLYIYKRLSPTIGLLDKCEMDFHAKSFNYTSLFEIYVIIIIQCNYTNRKNYLM